MTPSNSNLESQANRVTAKATSTPKDGIDAASASAGRALDAAAGKLDDARETATRAIKVGGDQARRWVGETAVRMQDGVQAARDKASDLTDHVVDYARDEPVKALLIAAAVGAAVLGLLSLLFRSDD